MRVETLRWRDGALELIDQRLLPDTIHYVRCTSAADTAAAIRAMVVRGAPAIGVAAAYGIALEVSRVPGAALNEAFDLLAASRPTAVNLVWALDRMRAAVALDPSPAATLAAAHALYAEDIAVNRAIGAQGVALVPRFARPTRVMTHCNAGALATAGHGTALGVIRSARDANVPIAVIANETRPYLQGARLTAWEMVQEGIPVTLVTDSMAGHLMQRGRVDMILVGADRIAANGDAANKIGTYTLAVLAARHGIPFYIAAPSSTFDLALDGGSRIPIEERPGSEVLGYRTLRWAPEGVTVANPAFDVTPAELITAIITERGVIHRPTTSTVRAMMSD